MKLAELDPTFIKWAEGTKLIEMDVPMAQANGLQFLCPKCFAANGGKVGTHAILCWTPAVPLTVPPGPGRWGWEGTGLGDLTLFAGSSSILLTSGCRWHGFVRGGEVTDA